MGIFADWPDHRDLLGTGEPLSAEEIASGVADREVFDGMRAALDDYGAAPRLPAPDPDHADVTALRAEMGV